MFTSSYNHTIDAKNRVFIPAKFREKLGDEIVISQSVREHCLKICSVAEWEKYLEPIKKLDRAQSEYVLRIMNGSSLSLPLDSTGRVQLTADLIAYAGLENKQVVIVGCGDYAEIWSEEAYRSKTKPEDIERARNILENVGL